MPKGNLEQIGKDYVHKPMTVRSHELVRHPSLDLKIKIYTLLPSEYFNGGDSISALVSEARRVLYNTINRGEIEPSSGMGFAVVSEDIFNAAVWRKNLPSFENYILGTESSDMREDGWGLSIVNHEKNARFRYLASERTKVDEDKYLDDVIEGQLPAEGDPDHSRKLKWVVKRLRHDSRQSFELASELASESGIANRFRRGVLIEEIIDTLRYDYPEIDFDNKSRKLTRAYKPSDFQSGITVDIFEKKEWNKLATQYISESQELGKWVHLSAQYIGVEFKDMIKARLLEVIDLDFHVLTPLALEQLFLEYSRQDTKPEEVQQLGSV